jgi:alkylation response protein AidB-like acyl-CoA dehydrogenase
MEFGLNDNQVILRDSAREFFSGECPPAFVRRIADSNAPHDAALWSKLASQGYTGIIFDDQYGGVGLGVVELVLLMEEAGRALLPAPLFSTVALAGATIDACGDPEQKRKYLSPICRGDARATLAFVEPGAGWDGADVRMTLSNGGCLARSCSCPTPAR